MSIRPGKGQAHEVRMAVLAAALVLIPALSNGQEGQTNQITVVTDLYKLDGLLPEMKSGDLGTIRDIASWCLDMAELFRGRLADARTQVDLQREAKKSEIKALEARVKGAGKAKDELSKKALSAEVKAQKAELDILNSVKDVATQEESAAGDFEAAGKSLRDLVGAFQDLSDNREDALRDYDRARDEAAQAGLKTPELVIGYQENGKVQKALAEAGKKIKDLGERLTKLSKARQDLVGAWEKLEMAKIGK
jgi:hypothetical protein